MFKNVSPIWLFNHLFLYLLSIKGKASRFLWKFDMMRNHYFNFISFFRHNSKPLKTGENHMKSCELLLEA